MNRPSTIGRALRRASLGALAITTLGLFGAGCLDRPVAQGAPTVTARVTANAKQNKIDKIDLLFMIDNSSSMADKQSILSKAVPDLVNRFVDPTCVDPKTFLPKGTTPSDPTTACPEDGAEREFTPLSNIHIGIISSSLGSHGASGVCDDTKDSRTDPHDNDLGQLVTRGGDPAPSLGFLEWTNSASPAQTTATEDNFANMVTGIGQHGCGYEAQLEAPYRFLVDPQPPTGATVSNNVASPSGINTTLLQQRADFLRPDSLLAVILVTDENDCSIDDSGQGFMTLESAVKTVTQMKHGSSACLQNPDDACCHSCLLDAPSGCPSNDEDSECKKGYYSSTEDPANLRCWNQKRRYGIDFLTSVSRYVEGFTSTTVAGRDNVVVTNPLFDDLTCPGWKNGARLGDGVAADGSKCAKQPARDASLVFVAGIVGVPWQDIARDVTDLTQGFYTNEEMTTNGVWPRILADSSTETPGDPLMIESVDQRTSYTTTTNPLGTAALPKSADSSDMANPVNGHEWDISKPTPANADLQYACIFDLETTRDCSDPTLSGDCDCSVASTVTDPSAVLASEKNPLCYSTSSKSYSTTQGRAKGYPGVRELQVLKGLGDQGIVASICPKQLSDTSRQDYGYRPAVNALIERLRTALRGRCMPRQLAVDNKTGLAPCIVYEAFSPADGVCDCEGNAKYPGRTTASKTDLPDEISALKATCVCEIQQLTNANALTSCQTDNGYTGGSTTDSIGWCYVDPIQMAQNGDTTDAKSACAIVQNCSATEKRLIRFVGADGVGNPRSGSTSVIMCQEATISTTDTAAQTICSGS